MATSELFFSEYVEGSSFNKAIEIFNGTGAAIDLAANGYTLELYSNGAAAPSQVLSLTGTIADGDVLVLAHPSADGAILAEADGTSGSVINFNGDDAVVLRKGGAVIDVIGQIGEDPGSQWGSGLASTADNTLRRAETVLEGDTDGSDAFDPATEWEGFASNTFDGLGTHSVVEETGPGLVISESDGGTAVAEGGATDDLTLTLATQPTADVTVTLTPDAETAVAPASVTFTPDNWDTPQVVTVSAVDDATDETPDQHASTIGFALASADPAYDGLVAGPVTVGVQDNEALSPTLISAIQGAGDISPLDGQAVTIQAIVTGDFQNGDADDGRSLGGFTVQEEDADQDGDAATSEGIYVFGGATDVNVGDLVTITGTVDEYFGLTEITSVSSISVESSGNALPSAAAIDLSELGAGVTTDQNGDYVPDLEAFESMRVEFTDTLTITEMFNLDRFNEIRLSEGGRPQQFTQRNAPDAAGYDAYLRATGALSITYDDGLNAQNAPIGNLDGFDPFSTATAPSMGDTITGLSGVLDYQWAGASASGATWRVRSTEDGQNSFTDTNPADPTPPEVGGTLTVASLNVLNFFTTLSGQTTVGMSPRGANNAAEYERQLDKLVTAIGAMDADVLGLVEIENDVNSDPLATLVEALNAVYGADTYAYADTGQIGTDAITTAFLYKPGSVALQGEFAVYDDPAFVDPLGAETTGASYNRPALAQTFTEIASGESFTAVVNHLKSKGSGTGAAADEDQGDGQGFSNATRDAAAAALADWLDTDPTGSGDPDYLLLGDYNAYAEEDPIRTLEGRGYTDLAREFGGTEVRSYVFDGFTGTLDYAFANEPLLAQITGTSEWHANADEADALDYNLDFGRDASIFDGSSPLRASDHDPVIVGLALESGPEAPETLTVAVAIEDRLGARVRAVESVDEVETATSTLPAVAQDWTFASVGVEVTAVAPGRARLSFFEDEMGLSSNGDRLFSANSRLLNGAEEFRFILTGDEDGGEFGDGTAAAFDFGTVRGGGAIEVAFYDDGALVTTFDADAGEGAVVFDLGGATFDEVRMTAEGNTRLGLTDFAFDRLATDDLLLA